MSAGEGLARSYLATAFVLGIGAGALLVALLMPVLLLAGFGGAVWMALSAMKTPRLQPRRRGGRLQPPGTT